MKIKHLFTLLDPFKQRQLQRGSIDTNTTTTARELQHLTGILLHTQLIYIVDDTSN